MDNNLIKDGERLDDLQLKGLMIIQNPDKYCFTSDSVLLSSFAEAKSGERGCDFCSGSGIVAMLTAAKNPSVKKIYALELQSALADMASRSVIYNKMEDKIEVKNIPVQEAYILTDCNSLDFITCNPPYSPSSCALKGESEEIALARHEIGIKLSEITEASKKMLRFGGRFYLVHKAERAAEIIYEMLKCNIQPKIIQSVQSKADKPPHLVLICGVLGGKSGIKWKKPLVIMNADNSYTKEAKAMYSMAEEE